MSNLEWNVVFRIYRHKGDQLPYFDTYTIQVKPDEYVLDAIERIWAFYDRSLTFSHACHHSTCGACGMRVNGVEKLSCITKIQESTSDGGVIIVEPMRNFPIISDLVVDMGILFRRMEIVGHRAVLPLNEENTGPQKKRLKSQPENDYQRLSDCIECGLCISACPVAVTAMDYLGPAVLAGAHQNGQIMEHELMSLVDSDIGVWRCHSAFECTTVCPSNVDPAWRIMDLRKKIISERLKRFKHS